MKLGGISEFKESNATPKKHKQSVGFSQLESIEERRNRTREEDIEFLSKHKEKIS